jgi:FkbM family methyltransferase
MRTTAVYLGENTALLKTKYDDKMFVDTRDLGIAPHLLLDGNWEEWITVALRRYLSGSVFFDVGANFGWFTLFGARHAKFVHAFEPNPGLHRLLSRSVKLNGLTNVQVYPLALADYSGAGKLDVSNQWCGNGAIAPYDEQMFNMPDVNVVPLDSLQLRDLEGAPLVFKIDVEGFEPRVVLGAKNLISRPETTAFVEYHPNASKLGEMLELFESLGYRMGHVKESSDVVDITREQLAAVRPADMLCFYKWRV